MASRPVIDVEVKDEAFEHFLELYEKFNESLKEIPGAWDELDHAIGGTGKGALAMAAAQAGILTEEIRGAARAQGEFHRAFLSGNRSLESAAKTARGIGKTISDAATDAPGMLAKIGGAALKALGPVGIVLSGIGAAVVGVGAGLNALAGPALSRQRSAFSTGTTPGQASSFGIWAQRFLAPNAIAGATNVKTDLRSAGYLATLGLNFNSAQYEKSDLLAIDMLKAATQAAIAGKAGGIPLAQVPGVMAYEALGGQRGDVLNAMQLGIPALDKARADVTANVHRYNLSKTSVDDLATLKMAGESAGVTTQSILINKTAGLAPFYAKGIMKAQDLIGAASGDKTAQSAVQATWNHITVAFGKLEEKVSKAVTPAFSSLTHQADRAASALGGVAAAIVGTAKKLGVDPNLALAIANQESGLNPNAKGDWMLNGRYLGRQPTKAEIKAGAKPVSFGVFQLNTHGGEGAGLPASTLFDPAKNSAVGLAEFARVMHMTPGQIAARERIVGASGWSTDVRKLSPGQIAALAQRPEDGPAYALAVDSLYRQQVAKNAPQDAKGLRAELQYAMKEHGANWEQYVPQNIRNAAGPNAPATNATIEKVIKALNRVKPGQVSITNSTSARVAYSINAGAQV